MLARTARAARARRSRSAPGSCCSGSTRATSATRSSRAARRGRRGSPSPARRGCVRRRAPRRRALDGPTGRGSRRRSSSCRHTSTASRTGRRRTARPASPLTPGLVAGAERRGARGRDRRPPTPRRATGSPPTVPVYLCTAPPGHVADTTKNRPYERRAEWRRFVRTGDLAIPRTAARPGSSPTHARRPPAPAGRLSRRAVHALPAPGLTVSTIARVKALLVSFYFPPAGGGGVQRPLKLAQYLPGARDRDARARARRPALDPPGRGAPRADAGVGPPRPLRRARGTQARGGAARQGGARALRHPGKALRPPLLVPGRERLVEPDRDPRRDPPRPQLRHRRRDHDLAAELDPPRRRGGEARDGCALGRGPARLARRPRASPLRERRGAGEGEGRRGYREARRALGRRDRRRRRVHLGRGARARAARARS